MDDGLPRRVIGDAARLRQVLLNLAGNAIKFTEQGGVTVIAEAGIAPDEIVFEVHDTGIGIAPSNRSESSVNSSRPTTAPRASSPAPVSGSPSPADHRAHGRQHRGRQLAGRGSTFRVTVPLPGAAEIGDVGEPGLGRPDLAGMEVLIVAPTAVGAALVARRLIRWGARTYTVPDQHVAAAVVVERPWSALLVDHGLGLDACRSLAGAAAGTIARRIVLIAPAETARIAGPAGGGIHRLFGEAHPGRSLAARMRPDMDPGLDDFAPPATVKTALVPNPKAPPSDCRS